MPVVNCDLLVIGAGPYGVATAAYAKSRGLDVIVCGKFMEFWKRSMPDRLLLRSDEKWHMDAEQIHTFKGFIKEAGVSNPTGISTGHGVRDVDDGPVGQLGILE